MTNYAQNRGSEMPLHHNDDHHDDDDDGDGNNPIYYCYNDDVDDYDDDDDDSYNVHKKSNQHITLMKLFQHFSVQSFRSMLS